MQLKRTCGPFTWKREDREYPPGDFVWRLIPPFKGATVFVIKNYGGKPGPGFAGWKLVSGGPFDAAGAYSSFDSALTGITPWLVKFYIRTAKARVKETKEMLASIHKALEKIEAVSSTTKDNKEQE